MKNQSVVPTKQKTDTNITQPKGLSGMTRVDATRIHTRPPNTYRVTQRRVVSMYYTEKENSENSWKASNDIYETLVINHVTTDFFLSCGQKI